jgi:hypothetical protein
MSIMTVSAERRGSHLAERDYESQVVEGNGAEALGVSIDTAISCRTRCAAQPDSGSGCE